MNQIVKDLFTKCKPYLDTTFTEAAFDNLPLSQQGDRIGELHFTSYMLDNAIPIKHESDTGLDLRLYNIARPCSGKCDGWAEFVCAHHKGDYKENPYKNEDDFLSRITTVILNKNNKILSDIQQGRVKPNEPVLLCINLDQVLDEERDMFMIAGLEGFLPGILRTVYPFGELSAKINVTHPEKSGISQEYQALITKGNGAPICNSCFINEQYSYISAVLFNYNKWGNVFILAHNYCAKNPIKRKMFKDCLEYVPNIIHEGTQKVLRITKAKL